MDFDTAIVDFADLMPKDKAEALVSSVKKVLDVEQAYIPVMGTFDLDARNAETLGRNLICHIAHLIHAFANYETFFAHSCRDLVISAFRTLAFLVSATDPLISAITTHLGDLLVEALAVCTIVRRTWVFTANDAANVAWESKRPNPIPKLVETWALLAARSLHPWFLGLERVLGDLVSGMPPNKRRSIAYGAGATRTLEALQNGSSVVDWVWKHPWFAAVPPPSHFHLQVKCSYEDLRSLESSLHSLEDMGQPADSSTSIVDAMLHIVLSSLTPLYMCSGILDGTDEPDVLRFMEHSTVLMNARLNLFRPPPLTNPATSLAPQLENNKGSQAPWWAPTIASTTAQHRTPTPGPEGSVDGASQVESANSLNARPAQVYRRGHSADDWDLPGPSYGVRGPMLPSPVRCGDDRGLGDLGGYGRASSIPASFPPRDSATDRRFTFGVQRPAGILSKDPFAMDVDAPGGDLDSARKEGDVETQPPQDMDLDPEAPAPSPQPQSTGGQSDLVHKPFGNTDTGLEHQSALLKNLSLSDVLDPSQPNNPPGENVQVVGTGDSAKDKASDEVDSEHARQQGAANGGPTTTVLAKEPAAEVSKSTDGVKDVVDVMDVEMATPYGEEERPVSEPVQSDVVPPKPKQKPPKQVKAKQPAKSATLDVPPPQPSRRSPRGHAPAVPPKAGEPFVTRLFYAY